ncbi:transglycosylase SLT domain-containing protein [Streptomyces sp. NPDC001667]
MRSAISAYARLSRPHKLSAAGITAAGAAAVVFALVPGPAEAETRPIAVRPVAWSTHSLGGTHDDGQSAHHSAAAGLARTEAAALTRSREREPVQAAPDPAPRTYTDDLDGWIREARDIMQAKSIPGSYEGIRRNIIRESSGDPRAINLWDSNALAGIPSKGLLQVIDPTFTAYHVEGTSFDIYDPVANITAACNYAADKYGSMDNVNSAY